MLRETLPREAGLLAQSGFPEHPVLSSLSLLPLAPGIKQPVSMFVSPSTAKSACRDCLLGAQPCACKSVVVRRLSDSTENIRTSADHSQLGVLSQHCHLRAM